MWRVDDDRSGRLRSAVVDQLAANCGGKSPVGPLSGCSSGGSAASIVDPSDARSRQQGRQNSAGPAIRKRDGRAADRGRLIVVDLLAVGRTKRLYEHAVRVTIDVRLSLPVRPTGQANIRGRYRSVCIRPWRRRRIRRRTRRIIVARHRRRVGLRHRHAACRSESKRNR